MVYSSQLSDEEMRKTFLDFLSTYKATTRYVFCVPSSEEQFFLASVQFRAHKKEESLYLLLAKQKKKKGVLYLLYVLFCLSC